MQTQRFAEAAKKFEQSVAIKPTIGALLNLGDCYEKVGRYASAVKAFDQAKEMATKAADKIREQEADARVALLRPALSTITIRASAAALAANKAENMIVSIDNVQVGIEKPLPVDGGEHTVKISARCRKPHESRVNLGLRNDAQDVNVPALEEIKDDPTCKPTVATTGQQPRIDEHGGARKDAVPPPASTWTTRKTIGVAVGVVGVVGLGVGSVFGLSAIGTKGDIKDHCTSYPNGCPFEQKDNLDQMRSDGQSSATISTIAFIAGGALLVGGAVLYLTAPSPSTKNASSSPFTGVFRF